MSDLRQCCFFSFRKQQPILDLPSQDPVLRRQIFVSQQEFLIDCSADMRDQARPKHSRASPNVVVEPGLYMLLRFQKPAVRENCETGETGNQAFSMRLRFLTIRDKCRGGKIENRQKQTLRLQPQFRPLARRSNINYTGFRNGRLHLNQPALGTGRKIMQPYINSREVKSCESQSLPFELSTCPDFPSW